MKAVALFVIFAVSTVKVTSAQKRIVGGTEADIKDHRHLVALLFQGQFICGASLLSSRHVLTAAHCLKFDPINPSVYSIRAGSTNKNSGGTLRDIQTLWMHPDYNEQTIDYDIAMLKLSKCISGLLIRPIALPKTQIEAGVEAIVAGWGATDKEGKERTDILRAVPMTIVEKTTCANYFSNLTPRMLCALNSGKGMCFGDSGGSIAKDGVIYGVNSFVGECGSDTIPSVTANVMELKSFIEPKLKL